VDSNGQAGPPIPTLPFHLVENFFHYPAYSVIGRLSGVAVGANGNIVALNRGYHPVHEFKADGSFVRTWGEGSGMFEGAHSLRFDARETSGTWTRQTTSSSTSTRKGAPWARSAPTRSRGRT
jgi:hypothetical protein